MKVFFLSDLHLENGDSTAALRFANFLRSIPQPGDVLILGGDIFDLFVGDKKVFREKYSQVLQQLDFLSTAGIKIFYLEGNHDFHLAGLFGGDRNIVVYAEDFSLEICGRKFWISHGDQIDPEDTGYHLLRSTTRHPLFRKLIHWIPGVWIDRVGKRSSQESRKYNHSERGGKENQERLRGLYLGFAKKKIAEGFHHVLVGHSHLRDQIFLEVSGYKGEYLNLGFSADALLYGMLEENKMKFEIKEFH